MSRRLLSVFVGFTLFFSTQVLVQTPGGGGGGGPLPVMPIIIKLTR